MSIKLPRTAIAALLASTLLLAGCSDDGDDKKDDSKGDESSQTSEPTDEPTEEPTDEATDEPEASGELEELDKATFYKTVVEAQVAAGSFRGKTTTTAAGQSVVMNMEASFEDGQISSKATSAPGSAQALEAILVDGVFYMKGDGLGVPAGKYLKIDSNNADPNDPLSSLLQLSNPENSIKVLDNPKDFDLVGTEDVDGVEANHYQVTLDSAQYAKNVGIPQIASALPPELVFDMWVDAENRPVKMVQRIEVQGQASDTEVLYFDYGTDVNIEAPAAADTVTR